MLAGMSTSVPYPFMFQGAVSEFLVVSVTTRKAVDEMKISGEFEVNLEPLDCTISGAEGHLFGRMKISKKYTGELVAEASGEMISLRSGVEGSAGYVALECVTGVLDGKAGSFALQHYGLMSGGEQSLILEIVPDSGTGALTGISGEMAIRIADGIHYYDFEYYL